MPVPDSEILFSITRDHLDTGLRGFPGGKAYCASKAAMISYCESLRVELRQDGIKVVTIAPGFIETEMTGKLPEDVVKGWAEAIPLKRGGKPEDVANACVFLASDMSAYITGQTLNVDGGMLT